MKKLLIVGISLFLITCLYSCTYGKSSCTFNINTKKVAVSKSEEFVVEVVMSNVQSENGIIAIGGTLDYDRNSLDFVKIEGKNGWSTPSFNEKNGKLVIDKNGMSKNDESIFQITFKVNNQAQKSVNISLKDFSIADGDEETKIETVTKIINIKDGNTFILDTTAPSGTLPQTGINNIGFITLLFMTILCIIFSYVKLKMLKCKI